MLKTGDALWDDINNLDIMHEPLVEQLLYRRHVTMLYGEPGKGKSTVAMQIAMSLSAGSRLFGVIPIARPIPVVMFMFEGDYYDTILRMRAMHPQTGLNTDNFLVSVERYANLIDKSYVDGLISLIDGWGRGPGLIILDPLYQTVSGKLADEVPCKAIINFVNLLRDKYGAAILLVHHSHRSQYQQGKKVNEDNPFYGSQWLDAGLDANWQIARAKRNGTGLYCKKDRHSTLMGEVLLAYDNESHTCYLETDTAKMSGEERVLAYFRKIRPSQQLTSFTEVKDACQLSDAQLRRIQARLIRNKCIAMVPDPNSTRGRHLWKIAHGEHVDNPTSGVSHYHAPPNTE